MAPRTNHKRLDNEGQGLIQELLQERLKLSIQYTFITVLEEEVEAFLNAALYQRTPYRRGHRNGHYERDLVTTMGLIEDLPVPRTRNGFRTELFERYQRRQAELDEAICEMFVRGVSTVQVGQVVEALTGTNPSPSTVSRVFHSLEADFEDWKQRKLKAHYLYGCYQPSAIGYQRRRCPMTAIKAIAAASGEWLLDVLGIPFGGPYGGKDAQGRWNSPPSLLHFKNIYIKELN